MKKKKTSIRTYKAQDEKTLLQQRLDEAYMMNKISSYEKTIPTNTASTWVPLAK
jgi:hypothetical protein